ncbi:hypothetical protein HYZ97_01650 [Candidatus Pacearchaeota archaeon]|nr:hypothetical protein [Candidatus Pacearchaeota archaeon]
MTETKPNWVKMKPAEVHALILELYKKGETPAKIGMILRDKHGIPKAKVLGKRISQVLKESNLKVDIEQESLRKKIKVLEAHLTAHKHDQSARRSLSKKLWGVTAQ